MFFQIFAQQKKDPDKKYKDKLAKYDFSMLKSNADDWQVLPFLLNDSLTFKYITKFIFETTFATQKIGCTFGFLF